MLYLQRYWRDALDAKKEALIRFLQNGSLEIDGGDGVMNDEEAIALPLDLLALLNFIVVLSFAGQFTLIFYHIKCSVLLILLNISIIYFLL
ncbi:putative mannosyl-oligosaccharide 1,3-1,6-alpha-mannosidase [Helianthus debilis subsp. tardiflorus]